VLNEAGQLPATIASVVAALGPRAEIIVVDGGSTDGTAQTLGDRGSEAGPGGQVRLMGSRPGRGRQLAAGSRGARGDVLLFLHADTWLERGAGEALALALSRPGVVGGCFELALRGPTAGRFVARLLGRAVSARSRIFRTATGDQAIFCRRDAYERCGGFTADELFEDVIFFRRLRRLGTVVVLKPPARTADRRWRAHGYARTILTHLGLRLLFLLGVPPDRLARLYRPSSDR
jgi:rSAM/selenodomain-associated transferase 2